MKPLGKDLRRYMNRRLETLAYIKDSFDHRHNRNPLNFESVESGLIGAIDLARDRGERVKEYISCYKEIMDEVYDKER